MGSVPSVPELSKGKKKRGTFRLLHGVASNRKLAAEHAGGPYFCCCYLGRLLLGMVRIGKNRLKQLKVITLYCLVYIPSNIA
jgi:hypothetical protein